jgi:putative ABC transport system permease protein
MRHALRSLLKHPGFTLVAVLTLALGLGVNAAAFSFVRDMVLLPRAQHAHNNLASLYMKRSGPSSDFRRFSYGEFTSLRESRDIFTNVTAYTLHWAAVGHGDEVKRSLISFVPENYFGTFGLQPHAGRFFTAAEALPGADLPVVIANHTFWQRMGGRADFVGSEIRINRRAFTVVGIAPQGFGSVNASLGPEVWLPFGALQSLFGSDLRAPRSHDLYLIGNLAPELSLDAARERASVLAARLDAVEPADEPRALVLARPGLFDLGSTRPSEENEIGFFATLTLLLAFTVLLVACLNLANMLLARGTERRKEIAIRLSLGASRAQVVRQLLLEGLVLAVLGGAAGLLLAVWTGELLLGWAQDAFAAGPFAMTIQPALDLSLLIASAGLSGVATMLFSLVPALRSTRIDLVEDLKQQPGSPARAGNWNRFFSLRNMLLVGQLALSLMLLFCAGLFLLGARAARDSDPGFSTTGQVVANIDYSFAGLGREEIASRQQGLLEQSRSIPGVASVALASSVPFNFELRYRPVFAAGQPLMDQGKPASARHAGTTAVTRGYFGTLGIPLLRGRDFSEAESTDPHSRPVAIIDETLARALFPNEDALGRHIVFEATASTDRVVEIIGIVRSARDDVFAASAPWRVYRPLAQSPEPNVYVHLELDSGVAPTPALDRLRAALRSADSAGLLLSVRPLGDYLDKNINFLLVKLAAKAFSGFAVVAIALAVVGVYGLKAYAVAQRTREIGIRLALGAQTSDIVALFVRQGAAQIAVAVAAGVVLAFLAGQALSKMLYRVDGFDPFLLVAATLLVAVVALLASWLPARRATRVDPLTALRAE